MKKVYLAFYIIFSLSFAYGQNSPRLIDVDFKQAGISQIVTALKLKTGLAFYYDPAQFDSLRVTLSMSQKPLNAVLDKMFENSRYHYVITSQEEVILTKNSRIITELAPGFFSNKPGQGSQAAALPDYAANTEQKKAVAATSENKIYEIGAHNSLTKGNVTLGGYIRNVNSGEPVIGASIYEPVSKTGAGTDQFGYYSINLPRGRRTLIIKAAGMRDTRRQLELYASGALNIQMQEQVISLKEVKVSAEKVANVRSVEMGVAKIDIKSIKQIPTVFGEADILRVVLTLPGVQTVGESSTG